MLEASLYKDNAFVTLTYRDESLPTVRASSSLSGPGPFPATLVPKHTQDWLKRFRKAIDPLRVRFFLVGEYGETTQRPHYHAALFGFPTCSWGGTRPNRGGGLTCCASCAVIAQSWGLGAIMAGTLETNSAQYIAGYVTKKMTSADDFRLLGRHPEFSRQSNRPGIGADFMDEVASTLMQFDLDTSQPDVPSALRHGSRVLPLGRYLRRRLRTRIGKEANAPETTLLEADEKVRELRQAAQETNAPRKVFLELLDEQSAGKRSALEKKNLIFKKRNSI